VAVLGNHDYHSDQEDAVRRVLEDAGVRVLEGEAVVVEVDGRRLGIAGAKGFGGGFAGACATDFGEPEMKGFIRETKSAADRLGHALASLSTDVRVALLHYSPVKETLRGEPPEIYAFLGSYLLAEAVDHEGADLVLHGHAHRGIEHGVTPGGIPVRNVAQPVINRAYRVFVFGDGSGP
jgi:Icc-related predicted phosphoesterase